jgi:exodeoxyribonuclease VII small subunit
MTRVKAAKPDASAEPAEALNSFETTLERLHRIVEQLESGDLDLEESLQLFEEGVRLSRSSQARLNSAEKRIEELLAVGEDGEPVVRELALSTP